MARKKATASVDPADRFTLTRIPIDRQGYARKGRDYYGVGAPLFSRTTTRAFPERSGPRTGRTRR